MADIQQLEDQIVSLSLLEASELVKQRRPIRSKGNQVSSQSLAGAQSGRNGNPLRGRQLRAEEGFR